MTLETYGSLLNPILNPNAGIQQGLGGSTELGGFRSPIILLQSTVPTIIPTSSFMAAGGLLTWGTQFGSGTATFGATSGTTTVTLSANGLLGTSADNGRVITVDDGKQFTITAFGTATTATGVISGGVLSSVGPFAAWRICYPLPANTNYPFATYQYFPAGAVFAGSVAGLYYVEMQASTWGIVYNNVYSGVGRPEIPAVLTPITAAGPGVFNQSTGALITVSSAVLPANLLGLNGGVAYEAYIFGNFPSFSSRLVQTTFGPSGSGSGVLLPATTAGFARQFQWVQNAGAVDRQVAHHPALTPAAPGTINPGIFPTTDTSRDVNLSFQLQLNNAGDFVGQYWSRIIAYPGVL